MKLVTGGPVGKLMRWYAWSGLCQMHIEEVYPFKMLLESVFGADDEAVADREDMNALRADYAGLQLAYRIFCQPQFCDRCKALFVMLRTGWQWYTDEIDSIKTPEEGLQSRITQCQEMWYEHEIMDHLLYCMPDESLKWIGFTTIGGKYDADSQDAFVDEYLDLVLQRASSRAWTKLLRTIPPFCYASAASDNNGIADATMDLMKSDFLTLLSLEQDALLNDDASKLLADLVWPRKNVIRLLYLLFERDNLSKGSVAGQRYLRALLLVFADNKLVEDIHAYLRDLIRQGRSNLAGPVSRASAAIHSGRLEERGITHAVVTAEQFRAEFGRQTRGKKIAPMFNSRKFEMTEVHKSCPKIC